MNEEVIAVPMIMHYEKRSRKNKANESVQQKQSTSQSSGGQQPNESAGTTNNQNQMIKNKDVERANLSKKRTIDKISNEKQTQRSNCSQTNENTLLGVYKDNFCDCGSDICKTGANQKIKMLFKQNLDEDGNTIQDMISMLMGSPKTERQISILVYWLTKIHTEAFKADQMDQLLDLFVVIYLKTSQSVQLTLVDDIDKMMLLIKENQRLIFVEKRFTYKIISHGLFQYQFCMKQRAEAREGTSKKEECNILKLSKIKSRCKRYDTTNPESKSKQKVAFSAQPCDIHGAVDIGDATIELSHPKKFISFICFLIQFKFKLLNIEDINQAEKDRQRKDLCNLLFIMLENCDKEYYYYPIRALLEFYSDQVQERSLGKRLNATSLLEFKTKKERLGRIQQLADHKKKLGVKSDKETLQKNIDQYLIIYQDTLNMINQVISNFEIGKHVSCYVLCLKIIQRILHNLGEYQDHHNLINLIKQCLEAMSQDIMCLNKLDLEIYYQLIKNLTKRIHKNHEVAFREYDQVRAQRRQNRPDIENSDDSEVENLPDNEQIINSQFMGMKLGGNRSKSMIPFQNKMIMKSKMKPVKFPNLSILKKLLTMDTIKQYPKLSLIVYEAIKPYVPIFDNQFISFIDICQKFRLIDFEILKMNKTLLEKKNKKEIQILEEQNSKARTGIKTHGQNYSSRENAIGQYTDKYKDILMKSAKRYVQSLRVKTGTNNPNFEEEEMAKCNIKIKEIMRKKKILSIDEIVFVFNFLLEMCKNAETMEHHAISLGTHMINDFCDKTSELFTFSLNSNQNVMTSELVALNFEMRSKKFIDDASSQITAQDDEQIKDDLFGHLFSTVYEKIKQKDSHMDEYTSNFFKIIIRIFQTSRQFLDLNYVKKIVDDLIMSDKLLVVVNSLPFYLAIQMFFDPEQINQSESGPQSIILQVQKVIFSEMKKIKNQKEIQNPMLLFNRMKNLIHVSTNMLQYFLCFQTPLSDKSSSSQLHSNNSQQYNMSPISAMNKESSQKSNCNFNFSQNEATGDETYENTFVVKKQKNCNFCGDILPYPNKFTFSRKCQKCSMKNSTLLLPARFLCNMCIDHSSNDLYQCCNDQIPLESIKQAKSLQSSEQIVKIQEVILNCFQLFIEDMKKDDPSFYFSTELACIDKASSPQYMYSNLLTLMTNRMLKLLLQIFKHQLSVDNKVIESFNTIAQFNDEQQSLTKSFGLTKLRIKSIRKEISKVNQTQQLKQKLMQPPQQLSPVQMR